MKLCFGCKINKPLYDYHVRGKSRVSKCKSCVSKINSIYHKSKNGLITKMYRGQVYRNKQRWGNVPGYTKKELIIFLEENEFDNLYKIWVKSGYKKDLIPSVDRIDELQEYTLTNIRLVNWKNNREKQYRSSSLEVCQMIGLNLVKCYVSVREASRQTGINCSNISLSARGKRKTAGGFNWNYKNNK